ncbi:(R)-specific enoyl-CoA hydratase [Gossypium arboreum]|uniref:(R)-specific enoyl-CoA hydratase n=1 Tax=Gossypium arboreum TaxID=29729 RepID=A0A0B0PZ65_GOSAR|nr:(R)-specific enoyl-CoA hydratase [Gossypium arboreum]
MFGRSSVLAKGSLLRNFSSSSSSGVLKIGDILRQTRTFSNDDVCQYSKLSHDVNPLHFDSESARAAGFEDRLVHGLLVAALFPWIISSHFWLLPLFVTTLCMLTCYGNGVALENQSVGVVFATSIDYVEPKTEHLTRSPVYVGDEIVGEVKAISIKQSKKRYIAKLSTKCFKNGELLVLDGEAMAILPTLALEHDSRRS